MKTRPPLNPNSRLPWEHDTNLSLQKLPPGALAKTKLSLVMPLYNSGRHLERTIRSLLFNDLRDVEVIVCDNESSDETPAILKYYSDVFAHVLIRKDKGQSDALNHGFSLATGRILGWLNGDDILLPNALASVRRAFLQSKDVHFCAGDAFLVEEDLSKISRRRYSDQSLQYSHLVDYAFNHLIQPSVFFSRHAWQKCGPLDIDDHYSMDADLFISMSKRFRGVAINKPLSYSVYHKDCKTRANRWDSIVQLALVQSKHGAIAQAKKTLALLKNLPDAAQLPPDNSLSTPEQAPSASLEDLSPPIESRLAKTAASMRIALVSTSLSGGAGIACRRMFDALKTAGVNVELFSLFPGGYQHASKILLKKEVINQLDDDITLHQKRRKVWERSIYTTAKNPAILQANELFSTTHCDVDWASFATTLNRFDIVHFHWAPGLIDFGAVAQSLKDKAIFLTLHDMNFFTGGCHYSESCNQFEDDCSSCPQLLKHKQVAAKGLKVKSKAYADLSNLTVLAPSAWMKEKASESRPLKRKLVHLVNNFISDAKFAPKNINSARIELGLPLHTKLILLGAESLENKRKGGHLLERLDRELQVNLRHKYDYSFVLFGRSTPALSQGAHHFHYVEDEDKMNLIYSACDCFCFLSLEENAPQTVAEALLSGCPVVSFPTGNLPDVVSHKSNGYLAPHSDLREICGGIEWAFEATGNPLARIAISQSARKYYDNSATLSAHLALYHQAVVGDRKE